MTNIKTAQEVIAEMNNGSDDLPSYTIEQMLLAQKGYDSFIQDEIIFASGNALPMPVPILSLGDVDKL